MWIRPESFEDRDIAPMAEHQTLFEWAGGLQSFDRMINAFYDRVEQVDCCASSSPEESTRTVAVV